ncbi:MAG: hypothetical protein IJN63_10030, partial [Clostridia bacterium]|nr:hypothetical protein [Clostridia bacterium]
MKDFCEYFKKYKPEVSEWQLIRKLTDWSVRADREARVIELTLHFDELVNERYLAALRDGIRTAYEINGVSTIVKYPSALFSERAVRDIILYAQLCGFLPLGFFDDVKIKMQEGRVELYLPYVDAISVIKGLGTEIAVANAIEERFSVKTEVAVLSDTNAAARKGEEMERRLLDELNRYYADLAALMNSVPDDAAPTPPSEQGGRTGASAPSPAKVKDNGNSYNSVYAAVAAPFIPVTKPKEGEEATLPVATFKYEDGTKEYKRDGNVFKGKFRVYDVSEAELQYGSEIDIDSA